MPCNTVYCIPFDIITQSTVEIDTFVLNNITYLVYFNVFVYFKAFPVVFNTLFDS